MKKPQQIIYWLCVACLFSVVACGTVKTKQVKRDEVFDSFRATLRFNEFNGITGFIAAEYLEENPITRLETNRLKQFRVSSYEVLSVVSSEDGNTVTKAVQIGMVHQRTASERQVRYIENWKWDEAIGNWRLHSGLPNVDRY